MEVPSNEEQPVFVAFEQKEKNFRKWESFIGAACKGSVMIDPSELVPSMKTASVMVSVRGAIRGYKLFRYTSDKIPVGYELARIKVKEGMNGFVVLSNDFEDQKKRREKESKVIENYMTLIVDKDGLIRETKQKEVIRRVHKHIWPAEKSVVEDLIKKMVEGNYDDWNLGVAVLINASTENVGFMTLVDAKPDLETEPLLYGWTRVKRVI